MNMSEQISFLGKEFCTDEEIAELERMCEKLIEHRYITRRNESVERFSDEVLADGLARYV